jgi:hypothetical protein
VILGSVARLLPTSLSPWEVPLLACITGPGSLRGCSSEQPNCSCFTWDFGSVAGFGVCVFGSKTLQTRWRQPTWRMRPKLLHHASYSPPIPKAGHVAEHTLAFWCWKGPNPSSGTIEKFDTITRYKSV